MNSKKITQEEKFNYTIIGYISAGYRIIHKQGDMCYLQSMLNPKRFVSVYMDRVVTVENNISPTQEVNPLYVESLLNRGILYEKYDNDEYTFKAPPVCTAKWTKGSWVRFFFTEEWHKHNCSKYYNTVI